MEARALLRQFKLLRFEEALANLILKFRYVLPIWGNIDDPFSLGPLYYFRWPTVVFVDIYDLRMPMYFQHRSYSPLSFKGVSLAAHNPRFILLIAPKLCIDFTAPYHKALKCNPLRAINKNKKKKTRLIDSIVGNNYVLFSLSIPKARKMQYKFDDSSPNRTICIGFIQGKAFYVSKEICYCVLVLDPIFADQAKFLLELSVVCLFVLRFYGPVNPMGSCGARSVYLTTRLLGRLSPLSGLPVLCTFFCQKLTTALLESAEGSEWP